MRKVYLSSPRTSFCKLSSLMILHCHLVQSINYLETILLLTAKAVQQSLRKPPPEPGIFCMLQTQRRLVRL
ncbi:hypothetical protein CPB84DRAFT_1790268, partial [Gymnopilus junonius]